MCWLNGKNARCSQYTKHETTEVKIQAMYVGRKIEVCSLKHICGGKKKYYIF